MGKVSGEERDSTVSSLRGRGSPVEDGTDDPLGNNVKSGRGKTGVVATSNSMGNFATDVTGGNQSLRKGRRMMVERIVLLTIPRRGGRVRMRPGQGGRRKQQMVPRRGVRVRMVPRQGRGKKSLGGNAAREAKGEKIKGDL